MFRSADKFHPPAHLEAGAKHQRDVGHTVLRYCDGLSHPGRRSGPRRRCRARLRAERCRHAAAAREDVAAERHSGKHEPPRGIRLRLRHFKQRGVRRTSRQQPHEVTCGGCAVERQGPRHRHRGLGLNNDVDRRAFLTGLERDRIRDVERGGAGIERCRQRERALLLEAKRLRPRHPPGCGHAHHGISHTLASGHGHRHSPDEIATAQFFVSHHRLLGGGHWRDGLRDRHVDEVPSRREAAQPIRAAIVSQRGRTIREPAIACHSHRANDGRHQRIAQFVEHVAGNHRGRPQRDVGRGDLLCIAQGQRTRQPTGDALTVAAGQIWRDGKSRTVLNEPVRRVGGAANGRANRVGAGGKPTERVAALRVRHLTATSGR